MRYLTHDPAVIRHWARQRHAVPALSDDDKLELALPDREYTSERKVSWERFERLFTERGLAFVYDEVSGSDFWAIGRDEEVRPFTEEAIPGGV